MTPDQFRSIRRIPQGFADYPVIPGIKRLVNGHEQVIQRECRLTTCEIADESLLQERRSHEPVPAYNFCIAIAGLS
jgi:hypothetical protein